jgi:hypothetical protein
MRSKRLAAGTTRHGSIALYKSTFRSRKSRSKKSSGESSVRSSKESLDPSGNEWLAAPAGVAYGDDFEDKIIAAADHSIELLVLLTPWALT